MSSATQKPLPTLRESNTAYVEPDVLQQEMLETRANSQAVMQVVESLMRTETAVEAARIALDSVRRSFGWAYGSFWTIDKEAGCLRFATDSGTVSQEFQKASESSSFQHGVGISGRAWAQRDIVFVKDIGQVTDCCRAPIAREVGVKSGMCMPIIVSGEVIGTMDFFSMEFLELSDDREKTLRSIARLVSSCIERVQIGEKAAEQAREIEQSKAGLEQSVVAIDGAVKNLVTAGDQLKTGNSVLAANADETATQANVVSAAAEEISKGLQAALTGTQQMSASIAEIARNSTDAAAVAEDAVKVSQTTTDAIGQLGDSSQKIGEVIKVISSIAGQTNLLALNATIEAARAGEAGKGFAVVANEVKELAKQTAAATEDISERIDAIQTSTQSAVRAITEITEIINRIYSTQNTIATAVEQQAATTHEIEQRLSQAAQGSGEVAKSISGLADAAQSTNEAVSSSNKIGREIVDISSTLKAAMKQVNGQNIGV